MSVARSLSLTLLVLMALGFHPIAAAAQILPGPRRTDWEQEQRKLDAESLEGFRQLLSDWQEAIADGDASAVARHYASNAVAHLWHETPLEGKAAIEEGFREALPLISNLETGVSDFAASGRFFYALGRFWYQLNPEGEAARPVTGTYIVVAERENRSWKIRSQLFKDDPPPS